MTATLGSEVADVEPRVGGMSPAVASTLVLADGRRAFVKAVGPEIHPATPGHFRHEIAVLGALGDSAWRACLEGTHDDGAWCAILMEDIPGGHPDWGDASARLRVLDSVLAQRDDLTPVPAGLPEQSLAAAGRRSSPTSPLRRTGSSRSDPTGSSMRGRAWLLPSRWDKGLP